MPKIIKTAAYSGKPKPAIRTKLKSWDSFDAKPAIGNVEAYISAVNAMPMLTREEEAADAENLREFGTAQARDRLINSHLRLVASMARQMPNYGISLSDLIQEGNIGLIKAVDRFDASQGVRLSTYAVHWIHSQITEYVIRNHRAVKIAVTKPQRKLFFNLIGLRKKIRSRSNAQHDTSSLTSGEVAEIANLLKVKQSDVREMEVRLSGGEFAIDNFASADGGDYNSDGGLSPLDSLEDQSQNLEFKLESKKKDWLTSKGVVDALNTLDARSKGIVSARWLNLEDDGSGGATLGALGKAYGVSAERIRQIEVCALKLMRSSIEKAMNQSFIHA